MTASSFGRRSGPLFAVVAPAPEPVVPVRYLVLYQDGGTLILYRHRADGTLDGEVGRLSGDFDHLSHLATVDGHVVASSGAPGSNPPGTTPLALEAHQLHVFDLALGTTATYTAPAGRACTAPGVRNGRVWWFEYALGEVTDLEVEINSAGLDLAVVVRERTGLTLSAQAGVSTSWTGGTAAHDFSDQSMAATWMTYQGTTAKLVRLATPYASGDGLTQLPGSVTGGARAGRPLPGNRSITSVFELGQDRLYRCTLDPFDGANLFTFFNLHQPFPSSPGLPGIDLAADAGGTTFAVLTSGGQVSEIDILGAVLAGPVPLDQAETDGQPVRIHPLF